MTNKKILAVAVICLLAGAGVGWVLKPLPADSTPEDGVENVLDEVTFQLDWLPGAQQSPWFLGKAEGYFEDESIDLEIISGSGSDKSITQVGAKTVTFALCDAFVLVRSIATYKEEMPVKAIGVYFTNTPISLIAMKGSGITVLQDLLGKKLGYSPGSTTYYGVLAACNKAGIEPEVDFTFVDVGFTLDSFFAGIVDVNTAFTMNQPPKAEMAGYEVNEILISDYGINLYGLTIICHLDTIESNPDLVKRFMKASIRSIEHTILHPEKAIDALVDAVPDLDRESELLSMLKMLSIGILQDDTTRLMGTCYSNSTMWEATQDVIYSVELIDEKVAVNMFFTNEYLP